MASSTLPQALDQYNDPRQNAREEKGGLRPLQLNRFVGTQTVSLVGSTTYVLAKFQSQADIDEMMALGIGIGIAFNVGGWALVLGGPKLIKFLSEKSINWRFWERASAEPLSWEAQIEAQFKPGRRRWSLPIGVNETGKLVEISMRNDQSHVIFSGSSGTGKSVLVNQFLLAAAMGGRYQIIIMTASKKDYATIFSGLPNVHIISFLEGAGADLKEGLVAYGQALPKFVDELNREIFRRQQIQEKNGARDLSEIRADMRPPATIIVFEEFNNALNFVGYGQSRKQKAEQKHAFLETITTAFNFGRSSLMHLVLIAQRPSGQIPLAIKQQALCVTTAVRGSSEAAFATGIKGSGAETLRRFDPTTGTPGQAMLVSNVSQIVEIPYTPDQTLLRLAKLYTPKAHPFPTWTSFLATPEMQEIRVPIEAITSPTPPEGVGPSEASPRVPITAKAVWDYFLETHKALGDGPEKYQWMGLALASVTIRDSETIQRVIFPKASPDTFKSHLKRSKQAHMALFKKYQYKAFVNKLRALAAYLRQAYATHDFHKTFSEDHWVIAGLLILAGASQNMTMKATFKGQTAANYRAKVKTVIAEVKKFELLYAAYLNEKKLKQVKG